ncbi:lapB Lipopolysaccharide assembly protein B [Acidimicrobiia bacterium]
MTDSPITKDTSAVDTEETATEPGIGRPNSKVLVAVGAVVLVLIIGAAGYILGRASNDSAGTAVSSKTTATTLPSDMLGVALQLHQNGQLDQAVKAYESVLQTDPKNAYALYNLGQIAQTRGDNAKAIVYYNDSLKSDPTLNFVIYNRSLAYRDTGRNDEAIAGLRQVVATDPTSVGGLYNLGNLLIAKGDVGEGTKLVDQAIALDPSLKK